MKELEGLPKSFIKWFKKRPKVIQDAIIKMRPDKLYKIKSTREQCYIVSYAEPEVGEEAREMFKEVTVTVQKTGVKDCQNEIEKMIQEMNGFKDFQVFGIKLDDLVEWESGDLTGEKK